MKNYSAAELAKTRQQIANNAKNVIGKKFNIKIGRNPAK